MKLSGPENIFRILEPYQEKLKDLGVRKLMVFGSAARGENRATSDLDFIVELEHETFKAYMDLKAFLEDLF